MRKVLFYAGTSPLERMDMYRLFSQGLFTTNSGNLLFQYGVWRALMTPDAELHPHFVDRSRYRNRLFIDWANSACECLVMPMANCFRPNFDLKKATRFIRQMKIPCVVIGIGLQARSADMIADGFPFDDDAKDFVSAVLDHSNMLGVRGEITADYLARLGFTPERHFTVIGCPSMYARGACLPKMRVPQFSDGMHVNLNYRINQPEALAGFLDTCMRVFPEYTILEQRREELAMLRYHRPLVYLQQGYNRFRDLYPHDYTHPAMREGRVLGFVGAHAWLEFMRTVDLNMGARMHGNIAAVLSGAPTLCITLDTRMEELCRYHAIPHISAGSLDTSRDPRDLLQSVDFNTVHSGHEQRFRHFVDFLNINGLKHIYSDTLTPEDVPFDRAVASMEDWGRIQASPEMSLQARLEDARLQARDQIVPRVRKLLKK